MNNHTRTTLDMGVETVFNSDVFFILYILLEKAFPLIHTTNIP